MKLNKKQIACLATNLAEKYHDEMLDILMQISKEIEQTFEKVEYDYDLHKELILEIFSNISTYAITIFAAENGPIMKDQILETMQKYLEQHSYGLFEEGHKKLLEEIYNGSN